MEYNRGGSSYKRGSYRSDRGGRGGSGDRGGRGGSGNRGGRGGSGDRGGRGGSSDRGGRGRGRDQQKENPQTRDKESYNVDRPSSIAESSSTTLVPFVGDTKIEKSDFSYKINPNNLTTVEKSDFRSYRLRNQDKLTIGKDMPIYTNVYNFKFFEDLYVDLYRVHFLDSEKKINEKFKQRNKRDVVMNILARKENEFDINKFVFDDANLLYAAYGAMGKQRYEFCIDPNAKIINYVRFEKTKHLPIALSNIDNTSYTESKTFLNLLITQFARIPFSKEYNKLCTGIGNQLFFRPPEAYSDKSSLDFMRQIWSGLCFSISLGPRGLPLINVNQNHAVFPKSNLTAIDFYCEANGVDKRNLKLEDLSMNPSQRDYMTNLLKGLNLSVTYGTLRDFTLFKVVNKIPSTQMITFKEKSISLVEYFKTQYKCNLKYPNLPLLQMNPEQANILIPMELVKISDKPQKLKQKLEGELISKMVKNCTKLPAIKFGEINKYLENSKNNATDILRKFGVEIGNQIQTLGKVLPAVKVNQPVDVNKRIFYDKKLRDFSYGIVFVDKPTLPHERDTRIKNIEHIIKNVTNYGCDFSQNFNSLYVCDFDSRKNLSNILNSKLENIDKNKRKNHLVIFIIGSNCTSYGLIKMCCEQKEFLGCHSQVLKNATLRKINISNPRCRVTLNISMKINGKLGGLSKDLRHDGSNEDLQRFRKKFFNEKDPTIFIGADVIHPSPQDAVESRLPSISAVVGSIDILGFKYAISGKVHTSTIKQGKQAMETLQFFEDQIRERLHSFKNSTGVVPKHIVIFRDGVADSQFKITMDQEVRSIDKACKQINEKYSPTITFLVVQKRHGVRFMDPKQSNEKFFNGNVPPNTVVANDIVNPELVDFYVVPHKGALGTSKPCHVYTLYDDWKLTLNEITLLTCWMANVCTRCPDPIGIPTPCYYADLACTRLKYHYIEKKEHLKKMKSKENVTINIHPFIENEQFFV